MARPPGEGRPPSAAYDPPGTKWRDEDGVRHGALHGVGDLHRYTLVREWDPDLPRMLYIGLNPAGAGHTESDATSRRLTTWSRRNGFGRLDVGNLFAWRAARVSDIPDGVDLVGPEADKHLEQLITAADVIAVGWGTSRLPGKQQRIAKVLRMLTGRQLLCFGITKFGYPAHAGARPFASGLPELKPWLRTT